MPTYYVISPEVDLRAEIEAPDTRYARTTYLDYLTRGGQLPYSQRQAVRSSIVVSRIESGDFPVDAKLDYDMRDQVTVQGANMDSADPNEQYPATVEATQRPNGIKAQVPVGTTVSVLPSSPVSSSSSFSSSTSSSPSASVSISSSSSLSAPSSPSLSRSVPATVTGPPSVLPSQVSVTRPEQISQKDRMLPARGMKEMMLPRNRDQVSNLQDKYRSMLFGKGV